MRPEDVRPEDVRAEVRARRALKWIEETSLIFDHGYHGSLDLESVNRRDSRLVSVSRLAVWLPSDVGLSPQVGLESFNVLVF